MKCLTVEEIITAVRGTVILKNQAMHVSGVSTDSRSVSSDDVFFALAGEKFDGHDYIDKVIEKGCRVIVISREDAVTDGSNSTFILVDDTLTAYQDLARYYKQLISPKTIGITGSVGKTSLKDMLFAISEDHYNTVCSFENENNHIGVPKTIFRMEENTEVLILEMGMSAKDEIHLLADIGRPDIAGITNIGISHIENFEDQAGIFRAKMEIADYFSEENTLVVMSDDPFLGAVKEKYGERYHVLTAGAEESSDYIAEKARYIDDTHITFLIEYDKGVERFTLPIAGLYNNTTAALAAAIMSKLDISVTNCAHSLGKLKITPHRLQLILRGGLKIIDDTYNASPASMKSAIEYLTAIDGSRKIAVLADMKELGDMSRESHRQVGMDVAGGGLDYLFTVGDLGKEIGEAAAEKMGQSRVFSFEDREICIREVKKIVKEGDVILVKGSHSMEMEKVVEAI